jgi:hypothetical protein
MSPMASANAPLPFHCDGCYDPETCPGIEDRFNFHCADCVLDEQTELEIIAGVYEQEANG